MPVKTKTKTKTKIGGMRKLLAKTRDDVDILRAECMVLRQQLAELVETHKLANTCNDALREKLKWLEGGHTAVVIANAKHDGWVSGYRDALAGMPEENPFVKTG